MNNVNFDPISSNLPITNSQHLAALQDSLNQAEEMFKTFDKADQSTKEVMIGHLGNAYKELQAMRVGTEKIPNGFETTAARIFFLYGKCLYNGDMQASRRMFELSLILTFFNLKKLDADAIPNLPTTDLQALPACFPPDCHDFKPFDDFISHHSADDLSELLFQQGNEKAFDIAMNFRGLGATYQNLDDFNNIEHHPLFEKIYGTIIKTWEKIGTPDSLWEAGSLKYNTGRFMHYLKHPGDIDGALKTLQEVETYLQFEGDSLRAQQLRAQIHNITAVEESKRSTNTKKEKEASLKIQFDGVSKAEEIIASDNRFDRFLQKMFLHNKAAVAVDSLKEGVSVVEIDTLKSWFGTILNFMETEKYNHYYFAGFLKNIADFELHQNNLDAALQHINKAEEVANMYPGSTKSIVPKIGKVRQEILEAIAKATTQEKQL